jgi:two-component system, NtrC family, sensor kinase
VRRNAQRVAQITQGLLSFARQSRGRIAPVDLNDIVHDTLFLVTPQLAKGGIRVSATVEPALPLLLGDSNALQQVLLNLLTNSCEAMEGKGGEVWIETSHAPGRRDHIRLTVMDTGCGIPADELPRIFDPFHTTKPTGTGLGLSITDGIIRAHHGTVDVHSEEGVGTTFTITFPAVVTRRAGETAS